MTMITSTLQQGAQILRTSLSLSAITATSRSSNILAPAKPAATSTCVGASGRRVATPRSGASWAQGITSRAGGEGLTSISPSLGRLGVAGAATCCRRVRAVDGGDRGETDPPFKFRMASCVSLASGPPSNALDRHGSSAGGKLTLSSSRCAAWGWN